MHIHLAVPDAQAGAAVEVLLPKPKVGAGATVHPSAVFYLIKVVGEDANYSGRLYGHLR